MRTSKARSRKKSHLPRGRCGLKWKWYWKKITTKCHLPRGRCGLKYKILAIMKEYLRHLPRGRCGLKFGIALHTDILLPSPSARKVWIEMYMLVRSRWKNGVTFRKEGVDWNNTVTCLGLTDIVTFRKEGVDWNYRIGERRGANQVTFRKEGVDWNKIMSRSKYDSLSHLPQGRCGLKLCVLIVSSSHMCHLPQGRCGLKFPSTNIDCNGQPCHLPQGRCGLKLFRHWKRALHSPGHLPQGRCGLKSIFANNICRREESPSARKVWIEIESLLMQAKYVAVTFCKEGVDWNLAIAVLFRLPCVTFCKEGVDWNSLQCQHISVSPSHLP